MKVRGLGLSIAGAGLALGLWVVEEAGFKLPTWLLCVLGLVAVGLFVVGGVVAYREREGQPLTTGIRTRDQAKVTTRGGSVRGFDTGVESHDQSEVETEDTDIDKDSES